LFFSCFTEFLILERVGAFYRSAFGFSERSGTSGVDEFFLEVTVDYVFLFRLLFLFRVLSLSFLNWRLRRFFRRVFFFVGFLSCRFYFLNLLHFFGLLFLGGLSHR